MRGIEKLIESRTSYICWDLFTAPSTDSIHLACLTTLALLLPTLHEISHVYAQHHLISPTKCIYKV
ncbi:MAG: hypothetical protein FJZ56_06510 [Chlamydiae bacterium]|nr:hypothetical protein [Chlamydiota bacterium]